MNIDNFTKILMTILTFALLLNGFNPWINPTPALAVENSKNKTIKFDGNCFSNNKVASQTLEGVNDTKRLLGYIESSVNEIQMTISGLDRKMSELPVRTRTEKI